jgi:glycosyltransferase involved in cell wall biosynthesis/peptidoglycan/xylan/chitin deacetylase (PgdA/CDA1 family)
VRLSVIIPTFNRRSTLIQTLPTVLDQTFPADEYEVIVVIDGSTDGTAKALMDIGSPVRMRVVEKENGGQAAALNAGIAAAEGELVLLLDDDLFCDRTLVAEHAAAHEEGDYVVFGPALVAAESPKTLATKWMRSITDDWMARLKREGVSWPDDASVSANSSIRRDVLVKAGGFDEHLGRAFDVELGLRLWKSGVRFRFCPVAVTHEVCVKTTDDLALRDARLYGVSEDLLCRKHPELRRHSQLADFTMGAWPKRKAREICVRYPLPIEPLLRLAERGARSNVRLGTRIFNGRCRLNYFQSAAKAVGKWDEFKRDYAQVVPVLVYRRVGPARQGTFPELTVEPGRFKKQMDWLKRNGYAAIRPGDWRAWLNEGKPLPARPVLITFDYAYADLAEYVFPVLKEKAYTATVFVTTGDVGADSSSESSAGSAAIRSMSASDIKRWSEGGIEFGVQGRTRQDLTRLSASELEDEVAGSGADLALILGEFPRSFAYPFGDYNDAVRGLVEKTFDLAFTDDGGVNGLGTPPHLLRRTTVLPGDLLLDLALRVKFGWTPFDRLRAGVRLRTPSW